MANLRAGLIGLGMMGRHHARVLASLDGQPCVALVDPHATGVGMSPSRTSRGATEHTVTFEDVPGPTS